MGGCWRVGWEWLREGEREKEREERKGEKEREREHSLNSSEMFILPTSVQNTPTQWYQTSSLRAYLGGGSASTSGKSRIES